MLSVVVLLVKMSESASLNYRTTDNPDQSKYEESGEIIIIMVSVELKN